jgi:hypothetical protein
VYPAELASQVFFSHEFVCLTQQETRTRQLARLAEASTCINARQHEARGRDHGLDDRNAAQVGIDYSSLYAHSRHGTVPLPVLPGGFLESATVGRPDRIDRLFLCAASLRWEKNFFPLVNMLGNGTGWACYKKRGIEPDQILNGCFVRMFWLDVATTPATGAKKLTGRLIKKL